MKLKKPLWLFSLSLSTGVLLAFLFPKFSWHHLAWFALIPLFFALKNSPSYKFSFFLGFLSGFVFFSILLYWILIFGFLAWFALSSVEALFFALFALGATFFFRIKKLWSNFFLIPAWWVGVELLRSIGPWSFSWGVIGYSQVNNPFILPLASFIGVFGLSFLVTLINLFLIFLPELLKEKKKVKTLAPFLIGILLLLIIALNLINRPKGRECPLKVAILQGNIPQKDKFDPTKEEKVKEIYFNLTKKAKGAELIIWPETSFPTHLLEDKEGLSRVKNLAYKLKASLLIGSFYLERMDYFNSAFLINPRKKVFRYDKLHLVPFGEYVPFKPLFTWHKILASLKDLTPGKRSVLLPIKNKKLGVGICFESAETFSARHLTASGANLLVYITNDAWFKKTSAAYQHLEITAMRAVENKVYTLQSANTGISAVINPFGKILLETPLFKRDALKAKVYLNNKKTFYVKVGFLFPFLCLFLGLISLIYNSFKRLIL